jgi:hypothetical protein
MYGSFGSSLSEPRYDTVASIPPLATVALSPGVAPSDQFGDPTYCGLHDLVRGLHGDRSPLRPVELFFHVLCPLDPNIELAIWGGGVINVKSEQSVDPYFKIPMHKLMKG